MNLNYVILRDLGRYLIKRQVKSFIRLLRASLNYSSIWQGERIYTSNFYCSIKYISFIYLQFYNKFISCQFPHRSSWYNFSILFQKPLYHFIYLILGRSKTAAQNIRREYKSAHGLSKIYPFKPSKLTYILNVSFLTKCCKVRCLSLQLEQIFCCHVCYESSSSRKIIPEDKRGISSSMCFLTVSLSIPTYNSALLAH